MYFFQRKYYGATYTENIPGYPQTRWSSLKPSRWQDLMFKRHFCSDECERLQFTDTYCLEKSGITGRRTSCPLYIRPRVPLHQKKIVFLFFHPDSILRNVSELFDPRNILEKIVIIFLDLLRFYSDFVFEKPL